MNQRTNPIEGNAIHLGLTTKEATFQPRVFIDTAEGQLNLDFAGNEFVDDINQYEYIKYKVTDGKGNEAYGLITDLSHPTSLDISSIINKSKLNVTISLKTKTGIKKEYNAYGIMFNTGVIELGAYIWFSQENSMSIGTGGGVTTLTVKTNQKLTVTVDRDWVTPSVTSFEGDTKLTFTCAAGAAQNANIVIENNTGVSKTIELERV